jgi:TRAP-type mannitol/chloroaromatic compound transport system permease small subunit
MLRKIVAGIDLTNEYIGRAMGWVMFGLVLLVTGDVISRYLFNTGAVVIQELEWWLYSIVFLMAAGYTFLHDDHVRVDLIYSLLPKRWKNIIDLFGAFIFLFPMCVLVILTSRSFIVRSWGFREGSPDPGGMQAYYLLKAVIPLGFFFLALQGVAEVYKIVQRLREPDGDPKPPAKAGEDA